MGSALGRLLSSKENEEQLRERGKDGGREGWRGIERESATENHLATAMGNECNGQVTTQRFSRVLFLFFFIILKLSAVHVAATGDFGNLSISSILVQIECIAMDSSRNHFRKSGR